jgi:hypothetical protein
VVSDSEAKAGCVALKTRMAKRAKIAVFNLKKGIFIAKKTKAFNWTAKLSIKVSEKNLFGKLWEDLATNLPTAGRFADWLTKDAETESFT